MLNFPLLLAQGAEEIDPAVAGALMAALLVPLLIGLALSILMIAGQWASFTKAGKPGWAAIVPIYNVIVMLEIAGKPLWWIVLMLVPFVNIVMIILISIAFAKSFRKGDGYGIGLALLPFIFFPMLGFGDAKYVGPQE